MNLRSPIVAGASAALGQDRSGPDVWSASRRQRSRRGIQGHDSGREQPKLFSIPAVSRWKGMKEVDK